LRSTTSGGFTQNPVTAHDLAYGQRPSFQMQQEHHHRQIRLKPILRRPFETEKLHPDTDVGACVKTGTGHKPDRKP